MSILRGAAFEIFAQFTVLNRLLDTRSAPATRQTQHTGSDSDFDDTSIQPSPTKKVKVDHEYYWDDDIFRQSEVQNDAQWDSSYDSGRSSPVDSEPDLDPGSIAYDELENHASLEPDQSDDEGPSDDAPTPESTVEDLQLALEFIDVVKNASLDNGDLDLETLARLRDPPTEPVDVSDPDIRFTLDLFLATTHGSEAIYNAVRKACQRRHPDDDVLSLAAIKKRVAEWSGVVPMLSHMCPNSCMAYTGPFSKRTDCRFCGEPRYDLITGAAQEFYTMPLGPQLQALYRSPESAKDMHYCREKTREILDSADAEGNLQIPVYEDYLHGQEYLDAVIRGDIQDTDV
ncbi:hypothetical protein B0H19DRAFT_1270510, partial [Mycena capillaripes]